MTKPNFLIPIFVLTTVAVICAAYVLGQQNGALNCAWFPSAFNAQQDVD